MEFTCALHESNGWLTSQKQTWLNHPSEKHIRLTTPAKRVGTKITISFASSLKITVSIRKMA